MAHQRASGFLIEVTDDDLHTGHTRSGSTSSIEDGFKDRPRSDSLDRITTNSELTTSSESGFDSYVSYSSVEHTNETKTFLRTLRGESTEVLIDLVTRKLRENPLAVDRIILVLADMGSFDDTTSMESLGSGASSLVTTEDAFESHAEEDSMLDSHRGPANPIIPDNAKKNHSQGQKPEQHTEKSDKSDEKMSWIEKERIASVSERKEDTLTFEEMMKLPYNHPESVSFAKFCRSTLSEENLLFWRDVKSLSKDKGSKKEKERLAKKIYNAYIAPGAPQLVNVPHKASELIHARFAPMSASIFKKAERAIYQNLKSDLWVRYKGVSITSMKSRSRSSSVVGHQQLSPVLRRHKRRHKGRRVTKEHTDDSLMGKLGSLVSNKQRGRRMRTHSVSERGSKNIPASSRNRSHSVVTRNRSASVSRQSESSGMTGSRKILKTPKSPKKSPKFLRADDPPIEEDGKDSSMSSEDRHNGAEGLSFPTPPVKKIGRTRASSFSKPSRFEKKDEEGEVLGSAAAPAKKRILTRRRSRSFDAVGPPIIHDRRSELSTEDRIEDVRESPKRESPKRKGRRRTGSFSRASRESPGPLGNNL